jgi:hypothetical protein
VEPVREKAVSVAVQTVLYNISPTAVARFLEHLEYSALLGKNENLCSRISLNLGDASPGPIYDDRALEEFARRYPGLDRVTYTFFGENTGTSRGHNILARSADAEMLVISNPDIVVDARALWRMAQAFEGANVGLVEAKQIPIEHPKAFTPVSGLTSWGSGAFTMTPRAVFDRLGGFDENSFFMYCDDVDYSWRVREAGLSVIHQPAAVVFHDKRLSVDGKWEPTDAERYYSAEAALLLAHKWSRDDLVDDILGLFTASKNPDEQKAAAEFLKRKAAGTLVAQRDSDHSVGVFVERRYAEHRYPL